MNCLRICWRTWLKTSSPKLFQKTSSGIFVSTPLQYILLQVTASSTRITIPQWKLFKWLERAILFKIFWKYNKARDFIKKRLQLFSCEFWEISLTFYTFWTFYKINQCPLFLCLNFNPIQDGLFRGCSGIGEGGSWGVL